MSLSERLEVIARALSSLCGVKRCTILLKKGTKLVGATGWGLMHPESISEVSVGIPEQVWSPHGSAARGTPIVVEDTSKDALLDPEFVQRYSIKGYLALPLVRRRHIVGVAVLDTPGRNPGFSNETIEAARGLGNLAAIAIENAETFEKWLRIAQTLQRSLLPESPGKVGPFTLASKYQAAMEVPELGGDFYDFIFFPDGKMGLVIADVSGKGLEAAVLTAMGKYTLRAFLQEDANPTAALSRANNALAHGHEWGFVTMFYGLLDLRSGRLTYANAGHPPALVVRASGECVWLGGDDNHPPLGVTKDVIYTETECHISAGDIVVGYTDGVVEARRNNEFFEMERLADVVSGCRHLPPDRITGRVYRAVADFSLGRLQDDIAIFVAKHDGI